MTDDLHKGIIRMGGKPFRRVRKHEGEKWKPKKDAVLSMPGVYCNNCRTRHAYKNKEHLGATYEKRAGVWHLLWYCTRSGNVLKDEPLLNVTKG